MERRVSVRQLNQQTSAVLDEVTRGGAVTITRAGREIARLVPVPGASSSLARWVEMGLARAPTITGAVPPPPELGDPDLDVAARLAAERDTERW